MKNNHKYYFLKFIFFLLSILFCGCQNQHKIPENFNKPVSMIDPSVPQIEIFNKEYLKSTYFKEIAIQAQVKSNNDIKEITINDIPINPDKNICEYQTLNNGQNEFIIKVKDILVKSKEEKIAVQFIKPQKQINKICVAFKEIKKTEISKNSIDNINTHIINALTDSSQYFDIRNIDPEIDEILDKWLDRYLESGRTNADTIPELGKEVAFSHLIIGNLNVDQNENKYIVLKIIEHESKKIKAMVTYFINITDLKSIKILCYDIVRVLKDKLINSYLL